MLVAREGDNVVIRMFDGEDVLEGLGDVDLSGLPGVLLCGVGMVGPLRAGYWNGASYEEHAEEAPCELLSLQGNVGATPEGDRVIHAHVTVARQDGTVTGGHLLAARAVNTVEIVIRLLPGLTLDRKPDPSGLVGLYPRTG